MLPVLMVKSLIVLVGMILPVYCALHNASMKDMEGTKRWLFYLCFFNVIQIILYPIEPFLQYSFSFLPLDLYWELKFLYLTALVVPRTKCLDMLRDRVEMVHVNYGTKGLIVIRERCEPYVKRMIDYAHQMPCFHTRLTTTIAQPTSDAAPTATTTTTTATAVTAATTVTAAKHDAAAAPSLASDSAK